MHALFLGLGGIGQRHLRNLRALVGNDARVTAYRTRRETTQLTPSLTVTPGENVETTYGVEVCTDLDEAILRRPEIAFVANPTSLHVESTKKLLNAGIDVLLEKPVSHDLEGTKELVDLAKAKNLVCLVAFQLRFHPCVQGLFEVLESGRLGKIFGADVEVGEYLPAFHPYEDYRRMYASRRDQGGGVVLTQTHELDLVCHAFGLPKRVYSVGGKLGSLEIDVEDSSTSILRYERADGIPFSVTVRQDYLARPARRLFGVWGERGRVTMNLRAGTLEFENLDGSRELLVDATSFERNELFLAELRHFLECVRTRATPIVPLSAGLASLRLALAIRTSLERNELVEVESV